MDKVMVFGISLILAASVLMGCDLLTDLNDGRIELAVNAIVLNK